MPLPSRIAVSNDSARRCAASGRTRKRSTTASMVCRCFGSSFGVASISCTVPSMRTRTKPLPASSPINWAMLAATLVHQRRQQQCQLSGRHRQGLIHHLTDGLRRQVDTVPRAARQPRARVQQPQVVVDLGDGANGRARVVGAALLLDRDRRRQPLDAVDVGLVHDGQELARVGRQRLDIAALALGVQGIEGQRGLARTRQSGEHDQPIARQIQVDPGEVMGARTADADSLHAASELLTCLSVQKAKEPL